MARVAALALLALVAFVGIVSAWESIQYDAATSLDMAYFASVTYCDEANVEAWNCASCNRYPSFKLEKIFWHSDTSTYGYAGADLDNSRIVIAFEGSQDLNDWLVNAQFCKLVPWKDHPSARVHRGFYTAYSAVRSEVLEAYDALVAQYPNFPVFFTGHSLGAALATVATQDLFEARNTSQHILYNYGSPRVGNHAFSDLVSESIETSWRITHGRDIVTHLPPISFFYRHIADEAWYPDASGGDYITCESAESKACSDSQLFNLSTKDHVEYLGIPISKCAA